MPGDDPRDIDWSLYLRLEQLTVKATQMSVLVAQGDVFNPDKSTGAEIIAQTAETIDRDNRRRQKLKR